MPSEENALPQDAVSFGPFRLFAAERFLEKDGAPLHLGGRALDILIVLLERAGEVVTKRDLVARVWPDVVVDEGSLRVNVAALRKALGDGQSGARYVSNVPGRGYCFVAPSSRSRAPQLRAMHRAVSDKPHKLPARPLRMVGRDEIVRTVSAQLTIDRFVTILGPGGIGKTTVAVSVGHALLTEFEGAVCFIDLGSLYDPLFVSSVLALALGLPVQSNDPIPSLVTFLRDKRVLLILDGCEHVIETAAVVAERLFEEAPGVHILATSRESLRVNGESVRRLLPLESPPADPGLTAGEALVFPAAQLFVERVIASGHRFELSDADAPIVAEICRRLDGIPLAIELAAGRVDAHGIRGTAALLDNRFRLLWRGRRTALPRHQTLSAMLDWSYNLLPEFERTILRRLSVFVGIFTLEAAQRIAAADDKDGAQVAEAVASLVAKSLVVAGTGTTAMCYRLLHTARAYALEKLIESSELDSIARHHAIYYCKCLGRSDSCSLPLSNPKGLAVYGEHIGNIRAALEWSFSPRGDASVGTALAAAAAPVFLKMLLFAECHGWIERSIAALDNTTRGTRCELELQASLGLSLMYAKGNSEEVLAALTRGLELAERLEDSAHQLRLLGELHIFFIRTGDFRRALVFAGRGEAVAKRMFDPAGIAVANWMLGMSHLLVGNLASAQTHCERGLTHSPASHDVDIVRLGFDHRLPCLCSLARILWLRGYPDQAVSVARQTVVEVNALEHSVTAFVSLALIVSVFLWIGDWPGAAEIIERLIGHADKYSSTPHQAVGLGLKGGLFLKRGEAKGGIQMLRTCLESLHADRHRILTAVFTSDLAQGLAMTGQFDEALTTIDRAIAEAECSGGSFHMPEMLRIRADILASPLRSDPSEAEVYLRRSLECARSQSALSLELRTATRLARLWSEQGRRDQVQAVLSEVYGRFTEGVESSDLRTARRLLNELSSVPTHVGKTRAALNQSPYLAVVNDDPVRSGQLL